MKIKINILNYKPIILLLIVNLVNLGIYLLTGSKIAFLIWSYWLQGLIIGLITTIKIIDFRFSSKQDDGLVKLIDIIFQAPLTIFIGIFFLLHYGGFQFGIYAWLKDIFPVAAFFVIALQGVFWYLNHLFSYLINRKTEKNEKSLIWLMLFPYARIIPIYVFVILTVFLSDNKNMIINRSEERRVRERV